MPLPHLAIALLVHGSVYPAPPLGGPGGVPPPQPGRSATPTPPGTAGPALPGPHTGDRPADVYDLSEWTWWWELDREPYLALRARLAEGAGPRSGSANYYLGLGSRAEDEDPGHRPSASLVRERIVPALRKTLAATRSNDVATACLVALARIGDDLEPALRTEIGSDLRAHLADASQEIAETALVSLGILADDAGALVLASALDPDERARDRTGANPLRSRAFAAYGLGLLAHETANEDVRRYVAHVLLQALRTDERTSPDVAVACVLALGNVPLAPVPPEKPPGVAGPPAAASLDGLVEVLLERLRDPREDRLVRTHAATAAARAVAHGGGSEELRALVVTALLETCGPRASVPRELVAACAQALGTLVTAADAELDARSRARLEELYRSHADPHVRHFALVALACAASRLPAPGALPPAVAEVRRTLLERLAEGSGDVRRWSALALGLFERRLAAEGFPPSSDTRRALRARLEKAASPSEVGVLALAAGLSSDLEAVPALLAELEGGGDDSARGHVAVALGLLGAREAVLPLQELLQRSTYRPDLLREVALSLGLLRDGRAAPLLVERLRETSSLSAQAALAQALGRIGDEESASNLLALLEDGELSELARAFAAVALGQIADADLLPWNTIYAVDTPYPAAPATLFDAAGYGLLNLL